MRRRLAVALTFTVDPPFGGGQVRAYNLYREMAREFDVEMVALVDPGDRARRKELAPGLWETRVPKTERHERAEHELARQAGTAVTDIAMVELHELTPAYAAALARAAAGADAVVACHPYGFPAIRSVTSLPVWYEAQDVEIALKAKLINDGSDGDAVLDIVERVERDCCAAATSIWTCSEEDRRELLERYGGAPERVLVVPNGANLREVSYRPPAERLQLRQRLRLDARPLAMFMASYHGPNIDGARRLLSVAEALPEVDFIVLGSVAMAFVDTAVPDNLQFTGPVALGFKQAVLGLADVALNPVDSGSGTNLKMLDYFAAGVPVISTDFGARGLGVRPEEHYIAAAPSQLVLAIRALLAAPGDAARRARAAREMVERSFSWTVIAERLVAALPAAAGGSAAAQSGD